MGVNETKKVPKVDLQLFKRTKIIATVGPATHSLEMITKMMRNGVNGFRINFSHGKNEERLEQIKWIRQASKDVGKPVAIILDTQGPKIMLGDFEDFKVKRGQELKFCHKPKSDEIPTLYDLSSQVKRGERLLIADGKIVCVVSSVRDHVIYAKVENNGLLKKRKGINLPDTEFTGSAITDKDRKDIAWGSDKDFDYIALSFAQSKKDIVDLRRLLKNYGSSAKIISKVETQTALNNIEDIVAESDGVMIARGDLAMEVTPEAVPLATRQIIALAQKHNTVSIVATQMLESMMENPEPTRAEVSDIATSVVLGADCVMLSGETAAGEYPIESIQLMKRVILFTQKNSPVKTDLFRVEDSSVQGSVSSAIITLAEQVDASAIVAETKSGNTALNIASRRPDMPIIIVASEKRVTNQMSLVYGAMAFQRLASGVAGQKLTQWLYENKVFKKGDIVVSASGRQPGVSGGTDTIKVRKIGEQY